MGRKKNTTTAEGERVVEDWWVPVHGGQPRTTNERATIPLTQ